MSTGDSVDMHEHGFSTGKSYVIKKTTFAFTSVVYPVKRLGSGRICQFLPNMSIFSIMSHKKLTRNI